MTEQCTLITEHPNTLITERLVIKVYCLYGYRFYCDNQRSVIEEQLYNTFFFFLRYGDNLSAIHNKWYHQIQ